MGGNDRPEKEGSSTATNGSVLTHRGTQGRDTTSLDTDTASQSDQGVQLKRQVGLWSCIAFLVGGIIGSGIFISPQGVTIYAGSVGMSLTIWALCGVLSMLGGLCGAELGTMLQQSGGEYTCLKYFYGDAIGFLAAWTFVFLLRPCGSALTVISCATYLITPFYDDGCGSPPEMQTKLFAVTILYLVGAINCSSVKVATKIQIIFMFAKILALVVIIIGGIVWLCQGKLDNISTGFEGTKVGDGSLVQAFSSAMYAYGGWTNLNFYVEEIKDPNKNIPRTVVFSMSLITVIYLLTNVSYYTVLSVDEMTASVAVAVSWAYYVIPGAVWLMPLFVGMSTFGTANGGLFATARLNYAAGRNGHVMGIFSMIHIRKLTPFPATLLTCFLATFYILPSNVGSLMDLFNFVTWTVNTLIMLQVLLMRFTHKDLERPYKSPWIASIVMIFSCAAMSLIPLIFDPKPQYFFAIAFVLFGFVLYFPIVYFKKFPPGLDAFTIACQTFLEVCPADQREIVQKEELGLFEDSVEIKPGDRVDLVDVLGEDKGSLDEGINIFTSHVINTKL